MHLMKDTIIRFGELAFASDVKQKTLRNWIDRDTLKFTSTMADQGTGWKKYSLYEVAGLALTSRFAKNGFSVEEASSISNILITKILDNFKEKSPEYKRNLPVNDFLEVLEDALVVAERFGANHEFSVSMLNIQDFDVRSMGSSFTVFDLSRIIFTAFSKVVPDLEFNGYQELPVNSPDVPKVVFTLPETELAAG